jgi:glycosyltransferase involved in cell wall biosynthesis
MKQTRNVHTSGKRSTTPLVSVLMPVYNVAPYLADAIGSILTQTVTDFEFLIIDDASTDNSWTILKTFAKQDKRIKLFRNKSNKGLVRSLNLLIPRTRGTFVARMDADDVSLPDRFEKQIALLETEKNLVACGGQELIIGADGSVIAEKYFPTDPKTAYNMLANIMVIQPPVLMARGGIFRKLRYDNHIFKNDDISIHFKLLRHGDFGNVDDIIFKYRRLENSLTHKNPKKVYFLALMVRINALLKYGYRPSAFNLALAVPETLLVALLPNSAILSFFEFLRFTGDSARKAWQKGVSAPFAQLARVAGMLLVLRS